MKKLYELRCILHLFTFCFFFSQIHCLDSNSSKYGKREYELLSPMPFHLCKPHFETSYKTSIEKSMYASIKKQLNLIPSDRKCGGYNCSKCKKCWLASLGYICDEDGRYIPPKSEEEGYLDLYECESLEWTCICAENKRKFEPGEKLSTWSRCQNLAFYPGYVDPSFIKYFSCFVEYLSYIEQNPACACFWPELSSEAMYINNLAYDLFYDLFTKSPLSKICRDEKLQVAFFSTNVLEMAPLLNAHTITVNCICHSFFFTDYDWICRDLEFYSTKFFNEKEAAEVKDKLEDVREKLAPLFLNLYQKCQKSHPSKRIDEEILFLQPLLKPGYFFEPNANSSIDIKSDSNENHAFTEFTYDFHNSHMLRNDNHFAGDIVENTNLIPSDRPNKWLKSDLILQSGTVLNELLLYKNAILILTQAIELNPFNRDAYIERAYAYFETNQIELALKDYTSAKKLSLIPPFKPDSLLNQRYMALYIPKNKLEFTKGLFEGTLEGAKVSSIEFVPSIFNCCRGILNGLWAFTSSPTETSQEMINAAFAFGEFISNHSTLECLQCVIPELRELASTWHKLDDYSRGQKMGYMIGKYGVDIFAISWTAKGIQKVQALRRANTACTLENCIASEAKKAKILEESNKRAIHRASLIAEAAKNNKILIRNNNSRIHIMQPKHSWGKLIKISGNLETDCMCVIELLEENAIMLEKYRIKTYELNKQFLRLDHEIQIKGCTVKAIFNKNLETGEIFLNDAWVITK